MPAAVQLGEMRSVDYGRSQQLFRKLTLSGNRHLLGSLLDDGGTLPDLSQGHMGNLQSTPRQRPR